MYGSVAVVLATCASVLVCIGSVSARDTPKIECENSRAGRHFLVDSSGYICQRSEVDHFTGCCSNGTLHSCETCHIEDQCCSSYEHCVSCCLRPDFNAIALAKEQYRIHEHPNTGKWDNAFQYCMGKCRTHQLSTEHENSFIDDRHFCFSDSGRPKTAEDPQPIPEHVIVAASQQGAACTAACAERSLACSEEHLPLVSQCDLLRDHFDCEAGCYPVQGEMAEEAPAYVVYGTPKPQFPTLCFILTDESAPSCTASQPHLHRLCACIAPPTADALADTLESIGDDDQVVEEEREKDEEVRRMEERGGEDVGGEGQGRQEAAVDEAAQKESR